MVAERVPDFTDFNSSTRGDNRATRIEQNIPVEAVFVIGKRILVADDDPVVVALLKTILARAGYQVQGAGDGREAVWHAVLETPDLVIMDARMPRMDGYEACRLLKSDPRTAHVPVVFISAVEQATDLELASSVGAAEYISKPFSGNELLNVVSRTFTERLRRSTDVKADRGVAGNDAPGSGE